MFNWAVALSRAKSGDEELRNAADILRLSVAIDEKIGVGRSSAQSEILLARVLLHQARYDDAQKALVAAQQIVEMTSNPYDGGCLARARAKFLWATRKAERPAIGGIEAELLLAVKLFCDAERLAEVSAKKELNIFHATRHLNTSIRSH